MLNSPVLITVSQGPSTSFYKTGTKTLQRSHDVSEDQLIWCMHKHLLSAICNINISNFFILVIMVNDWLCKLHIWLLIQPFGYYAITILILKNCLVVCGLLPNYHSHSCRKVENSDCDMMKLPLFYHKILLRGKNSAWSAIRIW